MKTLIVVPVYNEGRVFAHWLPKLVEVAKEMKAEVVVVDDGSDPSITTGKVFQGQPVTVLEHQVNCGAGAAIGTGLAYAREQDADLVLTIDGDGQHDPKDLKVLMAELRRGEVDIVNGSRFKKRQRIPMFRRLANAFANVMTFLLSGFWVSDSQSGMKGFSRSVFAKLQLSSPGYEWCTDVFREASWYDWSVEEVPISVKYTRYSLSKGQSFAVGLDMLVRLMVKSLMR